MAAIPNLAILQDLQYFLNYISVFQKEKDLHYILSSCSNGNENISKVVPRFISQSYSFIRVVTQVRQIGHNVKSLPQS